MTEFTKQDLSGARFEEVRLAGSHWRTVDLRGAWIHDVDLTGVTMRAALLQDTAIEGQVVSLLVNGVDVAAYVNEELARRHPELALLSPADAAGFAEAWEMLERQWATTVERARRLPEERLHERVQGEWSFIETLRHLVFATDSWILRAYLGDPAPWHPLGLPHDEMPDTPPVPRDRDVRPTLGEVLAVRAERQAIVRKVCAEVTAERLEQMTEPVDAPGYPEGRAFPVRDVLECILVEEWWHRRYAERDLDALGAPAG